jgi:hypothetical protein
VRRSRDAILWLKEHRIGLISSVGMQTWELLTALASDHHLPLRLYLPDATNETFAAVYDRLCDDYQIDPERVEIVPVPRVAGELKEDVLRKRDRLAVEAADLLLPISIRKGGGMTELLVRAEQNGDRTDRRFQVKSAVRSKVLKLEVDKRWLCPDPELFENRYLIHWTRGVSHAWPNEKPIDFYRAVVLSEVWPRSGLATLERIVQSGTILASRRHMPGKAQTVSFSALAPIDFVPLMRWRARYAEMSFEPYGVGIKKSAADQAGVRKVRYYRRPGSTARTAERWLTQSTGKSTTWQIEQEYRHLGDMALGRIEPADICLFCRIESEAVELRRRYPYAVRPLFDYRV